MSLFIIIALTSCSKTPVEKESDPFGLGRCDPGFFNASSCQNQSQNRSKVIELLFDKDVLSRNGVVDGDKVALKSGDQDFVTFNYATGSQAAEVQIEAELFYNEVQVRRQHWVRSGFTGLEKKREWQEEARDHAQGFVYVDVDGTRYQSTQFDTRALSATDWVEDSNLLKTWMGPYIVLDPRSYVNLVLDSLNPSTSGKKLHTAVRNFEGSSKVTIVARVPPNRNATIKLGTVFSGQGAIRITPVRASIQTFEVLKPEDDPNFLRWSFAGPISNMHCANFDEQSDREHTWADNFLCSATDIGLKFSLAGPINDQKCIQVNEPSEAPEKTWNDNYLCWTDDKFKLSWFYYDPGKREACVLVNEPSEPIANNWHDNYICW